MNTFNQFIQNKYIYIPFLLWFFIQLYKVLYDLVTTKKFNFKKNNRSRWYAKFTLCNSSVIGNFNRKIPKSDTPIFALALIMAFVVMYDACGVRRAAGKQAALLNKIIETPGLTGVQVSERLVEVLGHTPVQVFVGALLGVIVGIIA